MPRTIRTERDANAALARAAESRATHRAASLRTAAAFPREKRTSARLGAFLTLLLTLTFFAALGAGLAIALAGG